MECNNIYYAVDIDGEVFVKSDSEVSEIGHGCKIIGRVFQDKYRYFSR